MIKTVAASLVISTMMLVMPVTKFVYDEYNFRAEVAARYAAQREQSRKASIEFCKAYYRWREMPEGGNGKGVEFTDNFCFEHQEMVP